MARTRLGKRIVGGSLFAGLLSKAAQYVKDPDRLKDLASKAGRKAESAGHDGVLREFWDTLMTSFDSFALMREETTAKSNGHFGCGGGAVFPNAD